MPSTLRAVLFDLDGTLIDHFATLYACYRHALSSLGLPVPSPEHVRRSVGGSMEVTMRKLVPEEHVPAAAALWRDHLARTYLDDVTLMPWGGELVRALHARGLRLGVFTNKIGETSRGICTHLGLTPWLDLILGANDSPWRKPQAEFTRLALERLGASARETVLIGDSPYDIDAARAGGLARVLCVTTGTHDAAELAAAGADAVYPDLRTLGAAEYGLA
ncbi:MAG: HAD hydrolase-like protein [Opitutaceae bacterium]|nr:HAD hydrolase-like protein [Opitutaceae bacterium]